MAIQIPAKMVDDPINSLGIFALGLGLLACHGPRNIPIGPMPSASKWFPSTCGQFDVVRSQSAVAVAVVKMDLNHQPPGPEPEWQKFISAASGVAYRIARHLFRYHLRAELFTLDLPHRLPPLLAVHLCFYPGRNAPGKVRP